MMTQQQKIMRVLPMVGSPRWPDTPLDITHLHEEIIDPPEEVHRLDAATFYFTGDCSAPGMAEEHPGAELYRLDRQSLSYVYVRTCGAPG